MALHRHRGMGISGTGLLKMFFVAIAYSGRVSLACLLNVRTNIPVVLTLSTGARYRLERWSPIRLPGAQCLRARLERSEDRSPGRPGWSPRRGAREVRCLWTPIRQLIVYWGGALLAHVPDGKATLGNSSTKILLTII